MIGYTVKCLHLFSIYSRCTIIPTKTTASQNDVALSYYRVRGLYFLAAVFVATILFWFAHYLYYNSEVCVCVRVCVCVCVFVCVFVQVLLENS